MQSMALRFLTAGDSHGDSLVGIIEGLPAGIPIRTGDIRKDLRRRRKSYGRSERQKIENDRVEIVSGLWRGTTTGAPVAIRIPNLGRTVSGRKGGGLATVPRPGHTFICSHTFVPSAASPRGPTPHRSSASGGERFAPRSTVPMERPRRT
jgi:chorismate synthase